MPRPGTSIRRAARGFRLALVTLLLLPAAGTRAFAAFGDITLVGHITLPTTTRITNVWGYYDSKTDKEYALVGDWTGGFFIVNVTNPAVPVVVSKVTTAQGFDLKPFGHYVYSCDGNSTGKDSHITDISNPASPVVLTGTFNSCHTITISTRGNMFTEYTGVTIYDLVNNPENPDSLYKISSFGHDSTWRHNRLYDFNWNTMNIWNVTNPSLPVLLGSDDDPAISSYHSGDESKNGNYLYMCDELAVTPTPDIVVFDVSNPADPNRITDINDPTSRVHQIYVVGDLMFVAYYTSGFKVFNITNPAAPVLADSYDTSVYQSETNSDVYNGAYNAYPFAPSGIVYVSDHPSGLYLFSVEGHTGPVTAVGGHGNARGLALAQNYPNPFNPSTTISFELAARSHARLFIYDVHGAWVRTLVDRDLTAGTHTVDWNGTDAHSRPVSSGVYYYRLDSDGASATRRMVLLK
jgi:choice-of-anchor B domain-containing protein